MKGRVGNLRLTPASGPRSDADLLAAGWTRRFQADAVRSAEARRIYEEMGLEVRVEPLAPVDFSSGCDACVGLSAKETWLVYTRPPN